MQFELLIFAPDKIEINFLRQQKLCKIVSCLSRNLVKSTELKPNAFRKLLSSAFQKGLNAISAGKLPLIINSRKGRLMGVLSAYTKPILWWEQSSKNHAQN